MDSGIIIIKIKTKTQPIFSMQGNPQEATKTALQHRKYMYTPLLSPNKRKLIQLKKSTCSSVTKRVSKMYVYKKIF